MESLEQIRRNLSRLRDDLDGWAVKLKLLHDHHQALTAGVIWSLTSVTEMIRGQQPPPVIPPAEEPQ